MTGKSISPITRQPLTRAETEFAKELFEQHQLSLYRYLKGLLHSREEASEMLQETYLHLLRQPSFNHVRENARAYLFQIATNLARDLFRQRMARGIHAEAERFAEQQLELVDWMSGPDLALEGEQLRRIIVAALDELDPQVRAALLLHRFREMTHRQIAAWLHVSERTIERYIKQGLTHVANRLRTEL